MSSIASDVFDEKRDGGADWGLAKRLMGYVFEHKRLFIVSLVLYPITALGVVLPPYIVRQVLDVAIPQRDLSYLHMLIGMYVGAVLLEFVTGFGSQLAMSILGQKAMRTLRQNLFDHVQRLSASYYDRNPVGRTLTRLTNDVESLGEVFATGAVTIISDMVTILAIVGAMLWLDVRLTLFSFLVIPPLLVLIMIFRHYARQAFRAIRKHLSRINAFMAEHIAGMSSVQVFRQEERTQKEFDELNFAYRDANRTAIAFDAALFAIVEAIGTCAVGALIWYGANDMATGAVGAGTLVAFIQYIRRFFIPIRDLSSKYTVLQSAFASSERVFHLLDQSIDIRSVEAPRPVEKMEEAIEFRDVWFRYREETEDDDWILRGFNLKVRRGERIALVGATGSGKTTVLKLLNRSYDVQKGAVCIDGTDVKDLRLEQLRRLYAVVLQDVYLWSGSISDNLAFDGRVSQDDVIRAAKAVGLHERIEAMEDGYDTKVLERGSNFSVGERQLMAFARALALDPDVLVLDEATSNVDSETEAQIQEALDVLLQDRTALIVAHRLSTIRKVDRIIVLREGRVVEEGDHDSLVAQGGVYAALAELQFADVGN